MKELEKAMKIAQESFDETLFKKAIETCFNLPEGLSLQERDMLKVYDIPFIKKNGLNFPSFHQMYVDEARDAADAMEIHNDFFEYYESDFLLPNKESRRRTRKYKKVEKKHREERLYSNGDYRAKKLALILI